MEFLVLLLLTIVLVLICKWPKHEKIIFAIFLIAALLNSFMYLVSVLNGVVLPVAL